MKSYTITFIALLISSLVACARANDNWMDVKNQASSAINAGDCSKAWELVWPWAKRGNLEARAILATGMLAAGLTPPGGRDDAITRYRDSVILAVHGAAGGNAAATEMCLALIQEEPVSAMGGNQLSNCLKTGSNPQTCVDSAINSGFVPAFADYAREIDAVASIPDASKATCLAPSKTDSNDLPVMKK
jgi:hypothetical protein